MVSLVLFQPDIPQNTGSLIRLCACLGRKLHIIEPCGFLLDSRELRRVAMDYGREADIVRHLSWEHFTQYKQQHEDARLLVFSTRAEKDYTRFAFRSGDMLLLGRESAGVPDEVAAGADGYLRIPMAPGARCLNVAQTASMALGEALRQTALFPMAQPL